MANKILIGKTNNANKILISKINKKYKLNMK